MIKNKLINIIVRIAGCFLYASGVALFLDPNNLAPGGVTGVAVIVSRVAGIETGTLVILLNIPLLIIAYKKFGRAFCLSTVISTLLSSLFMNVLETYGAVTTNEILAALSGGTLMALGIGIVFKTGSSTGGLDIIVKFLRQKYRYLKTGTIYLLVDIVVIGASAIVFKNIELALYAGISALVCSYVMDMVLYGSDGAAMLFIISETPEQISRRILSEADSGVTFLNASGAYSGKEKKIIFLVVKKHVFPKIKEIVTQEDEDAFLIVSGAHEIFGKGYKKHHGEEFEI